MEKCVTFKSIGNRKSINLKLTSASSSSFKEKNKIPLVLYCPFKVPIGAGNPLYLSLTTKKNWLPLLKS